MAKDYKIVVMRRELVKGRLVSKAYADKHPEKVIVERRKVPVNKTK